MPPPRLIAQPIAEGYLITSAEMKLVWREYRWNTGKTSKMWFVDSEEVDQDQIEIRELGTTRNETGET